MDDRFTAEELRMRIDPLVEKIGGLIHGHRQDEVICALQNVFVIVWADACCANHRTEWADNLAGAIPKMLEAARRHALERDQQRWRDAGARRRSRSVPSDNADLADEVAALLTKLDAEL